MFVWVNAVWMAIWEFVLVGVLWFVLRMRFWRMGFRGWLVRFGVSLVAGFDVVV